jgi:hypothetical protein
MLDIKDCREFDRLGGAIIIRVRKRGVRHEQSRTSAPIWRKTDAATLRRAHDARIESAGEILAAACRRTTPLHARVRGVSIPGTGFGLLVRGRGIVAGDDPRGQSRGSSTGLAEHIKEQKELN